MEQRAGFDAIAKRLPVEEQTKVPPFLIYDIDLKGKYNIVRSLDGLLTSYKRFKEEKREEVEEAEKQGKFDIFKKNLVDITNFLNSYNLFMFMAVSAYNTMVETLKQQLPDQFSNLEYAKYNQIDPKYRHYPDDDNLKKFKDSMENNINNIYDNLLYFMKPFYGEKFDLNP